MSGIDTQACDSKSQLGEMKQVSVIGAGSWATAVAWLLSEKGHTVKMWAREPEIAKTINAEHRNPLYLTDVVFNEKVTASPDIKEALQGAQAVVMVTPSIGVRSTAEAMAPHLSKNTPVIILSKGIEEETSMLMTDILEEIFGNPRRLAALSGPNHAEEVSKGVPSATVVASTSGTTAEFFQDLFQTSFFRVYTNTDLIGVEMCGAGKNIIAIATGICDGLGLGDNTKASVMTRGLAELSRLGLVMGANPLTFMGLAGMGDLIVTCTSKHSRNRGLGEFLGSGKTLEDYQAQTNMVAEGAVACRSFHKLSQEKGVEMPLTELVYSVLYEGGDPKDAVDALMERPPKKEQNHV